MEIIKALKEELDALSDSTQMSLKVVQVAQRKIGEVNYDKIS